MEHAGWNMPDGAEEGAVDASAGCVEEKEQASRLGSPLSMQGCTMQKILDV